MATSTDGVTRLIGARGAEIARRRGVEPGGLRRELRGDLDWIAPRCLEREPARRATLAEAQAREIAERHMARTANERDRSVELAREHDRTQEFLLSQFSNGDPTLFASSDEDVRKVLETGAARLRAGRFGDDPTAGANIRRNLARGYRRLGDYEKAVALLQEAGAGNPAGSSDLDHARAHVAAGRYEEADALLETLETRHPLGVDPEATVEPHGDEAVPRPRQ